MFRQTGSSFPFLLFQDDCYLLNPQLHIWADCVAFAEHCVLGRSLEKRGEPQKADREYRAAEALYQDEFLADDRYEDWLLAQRENLQRTYLGLLDRLGQYELEQGSPEACITLLQKILSVEPCNEDAHMRLMLCHSQQGQRHLALRQHHQYVSQLKQELDAPPSAAMCIAIPPALML